MARSANQKLKLLYLMRYLLEKSDQAHPLTVPDMIAELASYDIAAERKSIYDDLEALRVFGLDVIQTRNKTTGYFIGNRDFELPELKLLVDSVQSSKFITHKKTMELISKIERLASTWDAQLLQRQVYVRGRVKSMNESVYHNVDELSAAITADREVSFLYFEYAVSKERRFRRGGERYRVSPFALMWDDENYYLLGWDDEAGKLKHYRVDKMTGISMTEDRRRGKEAFAQVNMSDYAKGVFGMFTGQRQAVRLRFANHLAGAVLDRFGKDVMLIAEDEERFTVTVDVTVSPPFYGWLFGFGAQVEVLAPPELRAELKERAAEVTALYSSSC